MYCKYCNGKLDPKNTVCPKCGRPAETDGGGNGFWDMVTGAPELLRESRPVSASAAQPEAWTAAQNKSAKQTVVNILTLVLCGLCLVCVVLMAFKLNRLDNEVDALANNKVTEETKAPENSSDVEPAQECEITKQPSDVEVVAGSESKLLFSVHIEGDAENFVWQKKRADGTWEDINDEEHFHNYIYGLLVETDLENGVTELHASTIKQDAAGTYRCLVIPVDGEDLPSDEVTLTVNGTQPDPSIDPVQPTKYKIG